MNRRTLLKYLLATPLAATIDYEKLLWIPEPRIVVPATRIFVGYSEILNAELNRVVPFIHGIFENDDLFYTMLRDKRNLLIRTTGIKIPLEKK